MIWITWVNIYIPLHPLSKIEISEYINHETRFNGVFLRHDLSRIKDGSYVMIFDDKKIKGAHWVSLFFDGNTEVYFAFFGTEYILFKIY